KFSSLPEDILALKKLRSIRLRLSEQSEPEYRDIFSMLSRLPALERIDARKTGLKAFPPEFGLLKNVEDIDLSGNDVPRIPREFHNLTQLKVLNLSSCSIPKGELKNLKEALPYTEIIC
ncbi:MAG: hypothetical protein GY765_38485, partial [bacterium]|nr:hypothetical protein [bacterium]